MVLVRPQIGRHVKELVELSRLRRQILGFGVSISSSGSAAGIRRRRHRSSSSRFPPWSSRSALSWLQSRRHRTEHKRRPVAVQQARGRKRTPEELVLDIWNDKDLLRHRKGRMQFLRVCPDDRRRTDLLAMPTHGVIKCNGMVIERDKFDILVVDRERRHAGR